MHRLVEYAVALPPGQHDCMIMVVSSYSKSAHGRDDDEPCPGGSFPTLRGTVFEMLGSSCHGERLVGVSINMIYMKDPVHGLCSLERCRYQLLL